MVQELSSISRSQISFRDIVFVLGGPGSGKGTQCQLIAKEFNFVHLSAGELLRNEVAAGTPLGAQIEGHLKEGSIVPTEITLALLKKAMEASSASSRGFLIDGFPRQLEQAEAFEREIGTCKFVLYFECSERTLEKRLLIRGQSSGRSDDNAESIKKRFATFTHTSFPVIQHYMKKEKCVTVTNLDLDVGSISFDDVKISSEMPVDLVFMNVRKYFVKSPLLLHNNIIFVLGAPGSGKGTQCSQLALEYNLVHLSTGDLLRDEVARQTQIGREAEDLMKNGRLVPSWLVLHILKIKIAENMDAKGFLIDGFPRAQSQAIEFENTIGPCRLVLFFNCPLEMAQHRLLERGKTSGRSDDNLDIIKTRFVTFEAESLPVITYFKEKGCCVEIDASTSVGEIYNQVRKSFIPPKRMDLSNVVFVLGAPGSGKGTQCERLAAQFGLTHLSIGDLLRMEVKRESQVGLLVSHMIKNGVMVPISTIMKILVGALNEHKDSRGFLIDGFPRSLSQALEFERIVCRPRLVLHFHSELDELEKRLLERGKSSGRADDTLDTIRHRFHVFQSESLPVVHYYESRFMLVSISSRPPIDQVYNVAQKYFRALPFEGETIVFVTGGSGAGKRTQCGILSKLGYAHIRVSEIIREEIEAGFHLSSKLKRDMLAGNPVPTEIVLYLLERAMEKHRGCRGYLLDGFPFNLEQAELFERNIGRCSRMLYFDVSPATQVSRLAAKYEKMNTNVDIAVLQRKQAVFTKSSKKVVKYYKQTGIIRTVNAEMTTTEVTRTVTSAIEGL